jgi:hypothetical protein
MIEIRFDKTKDEVALLIWFLVDHSVYYNQCFLLLCLKYLKILKTCELDLRVKFIRNSVSTICKLVHKSSINTNDFKTFVSIHSTSKVSLLFQSLESCIFLILIIKSGFPKICLRNQSNRKKGQP